MMKIIPVNTGENLEHVRILFQEYAAWLGFDLCFQNFEEELAGLPGDYASPHGCLLLATYHNEITGCIAVRKIDDGICEMKRLFVRPQYQGLSIGRALAETAISEARTIGYHRMFLDTVPSMHRARALYDSLGFVEIGPYYHNPIPGAVYLGLDLEGQP
jgi:ribosomal protein S18 acetylase RimI-like enzyme